MRLTCVHRGLRYHDDHDTIMRLQKTDYDDVNVYVE